PQALVGDELAARHHFLRGQAELAARRHFGAQQVAGRDVGHLEVLLQPCRLRSLAGARRAQQNQSHQPLTPEAFHCVRIAGAALDCHFNPYPPPLRNPPRRLPPAYPRRSAVRPTEPHAAAAYSRRFPLRPHRGGGARLPLYPIPPAPQEPSMPSGTLLYAQSGGVTAVINTTAAAVVEAARARKVRVLAARNGILGALREELFDTSREPAAAVRALAHTPGGAFGSCRVKLKSLDQDRARYEWLIEVLRAHDVRWFLYNGGNDSADTGLKLS